jgi:aldehyde:ferredoxin oxidoreductase
VLFRSNLTETNFAESELLPDRFQELMGGKKVDSVGCPVGITHLTRINGQFIPYDYEGVVSLGPLLGILQPQEVVKLLGRAWDAGLDPTSLGAILAYLTEKENLNFGNLETYLVLLEAFLTGKEDWALELRGGLPNHPTALTLSGMEFLPYFNGYGSVLSQILGWGITTEDNRGYLVDLDLLTKSFNASDIVGRLVEAQKKVILSQLLVGSGYLASVFEDEANAFAILEAVGAPFSHEHLSKVVEETFRKMLDLQKRGGFVPANVKIPKKFFEVPSPQGILHKADLAEMVKVYTNNFYEPTN